MQRRQCLKILALILQCKNYTTFRVQTSNIIIYMIIGALSSELVGRQVGTYINIIMVGRMCAAESKKHAALCTLLVKAYTRRARTTRQFVCIVAATMRGMSKMVFYIVKLDRKGVSRGFGYGPRSQQLYHTQVPTIYLSGGRNEII